MSIQNFCTICKQSFIMLDLFEGSNGPDTG